MQRITLVFGILALLVFAVGIYGCSGGKKADNGSTADDGHEDHEDHGDHDTGGTSGKTDMQKMNEELAKLSSEDRQSAEKQHFCPVSNKMLGTMGPPKKLEVKGQTVWICCSGCEQKVLDDPDTYLAKIKK